MTNETELVEMEAVARDGDLRVITREQWLQLIADYRKKCIELDFAHRRRRKLGADMDAALKAAREDGAESQKDVASLISRLEGTVGQQQYETVLDDNTRLREALVLSQEQREELGKTLEYARGPGSFTAGP